MLKQTLGAWFGRSKVIKNMEYRQSQGNCTLFIKHSDPREVTALLVYVGNITAIGNEKGKTNFEALFDQGV